MLRIHNPRGPHQSPKITKNTPNIDAFTLAPLKLYKNHAVVAINSYQSPASSNLIHIQGARAARPWPQSPKLQKIIPKMLRQPQILPRTQSFASISSTPGEATPYIRDPRGPHQRPSWPKTPIKWTHYPLHLWNGRIRIEWFYHMSKYRNLSSADQTLQIYVFFVGFDSTW